MNIYFSHHLEGLTSSIQHHNKDHESRDSPLESSVSHDGNHFLWLVDKVRASVTVGRCFGPPVQYNNIGLLHEREGWARGRQGEGRGGGEGTEGHSDHRGGDGCTASDRRIEYSISSSLWLEEDLPVLCLIGSPPSLTFIIIHEDREGSMEVDSGKSAMAVMKDATTAQSVKVGEILMDFTFSSEDESSATCYIVSHDTLMKCIDAIEGIEGLDKSREIHVTAGEGAGSFLITYAIDREGHRVKTLHLSLDSSLGIIYHSQRVLEGSSDFANLPKLSAASHVYNELDSIVVKETPTHGLHLPSLVYCGGFLWCLSLTDMKIFVWSGVRGCLVGCIDIEKTDVVRRGARSLKIVVAPDATFIALYSPCGVGGITVIDLNVYFSLHPHHCNICHLLIHQESVKQAPVPRESQGGGGGGGEEGANNNALLIQGRLSLAPDTRGVSWFKRVAYYESLVPIASIRTTKQNARRPWKSKSGTDSKVSHAMFTTPFRTLSVGAEGEWTSTQYIASVKITIHSSIIVVLTPPEGGRLVVSYESSLNQSTTVRYPIEDSAFLLMPGDRSESGLWYTLRGGYLRSHILSSSSATEAIKRLILFHGRPIASHFCEINDLTDLHTRIGIDELKLGLSNHHTEAIIAALSSLEGGLQLEGTVLLSSYMKSYWNCPKDHHSFNKLLQYSIKFVTLLIDKITQEISSAKDIVITTLMNDLLCYRSIDFILNHKLLETRIEDHSGSNIGSSRACHGGDNVPVISYNWSHGAHMKRLSAVDGVGLGVGLPFRRDRPPAAGDDAPSIIKYGIGIWFTRWKDMSAEMVIVDALTYGCVSSAISFLSTRDQSIKGTSSYKQLDSLGKVTYIPPTPSSFRGFRYYGGRFIYKLLCHENMSSLHSAVVMLTNMGENVDLFLRDVAFNTGKRNLRRRLLRHLSHTKGISTEDREAVEFCRLLEALYPNACYSVEMNRSWTQQLKSAACAREGGGSTTGSCGEIIKEHSHAMQSFTTESVVVEEYCDDILMKGSAVTMSPDSTASGGLFSVRRSFSDRFPCGDISDRHGVDTSLGGGRSNNVDSLILQDTPFNQADEELKQKINLELLEVTHSDSSKKDDFSCKRCSVPESELAVTADAFICPVPIRDGGYIHLALSWVSEFDEASRHRILMEAGYNATEEGKLQGGKQRRFELEYYLSHNDWRGVVEWAAASSSSEPILLDIQCCHFIKELLLNELAKRGRFAPQEISNFIDVASRLSKSSQLFSPGSLKDLMPSGLPSPFHQYFIDFCVTNDFYPLLQEYVVYYKLDNVYNSSVAVNDSSQRLSLEWKYFLRGRLGDPHSLYEAALYDGLIILGGVPDAKACQSRLNYFLSKNRPLMSLATLMYAPITSIESALLSGKESEFYLDGALLQASIGDWPSLHGAIFTEGGAGFEEERSVDSAFSLLHCKSFNKDVSLIDLLEDTVPFDLRSFLLSRSTSARSPSGSHDDDWNILHFSSTALRQEHGYCEALGPDYYLAKGRPLQAFCEVLKSNLADDNFMSLLRKKECTLSAANRERLLLIARRAALKDVLKSSILAAATSFLHLFGIETETLRVDIEAARRIISFQSTYEGSGSVDQEVVDRVSDMFLGFTVSEAAEATAAPCVMQALEILGEATRDLVSKRELSNGSSTTVSAASTDKGVDLKTFIYPDSPWKLVTLFCRVHGLARSLALLHELARRNDWVIFLHEAQRESCPPSTVVSIVRNIFSDVFLRDHMYISLQQHHEGGDNTLHTSTSSDEVFDLILEHRDKGYKYLLQVATASKRSILAMIASTYPAADVVECWVVWLCVHEACADLPWIYSGSAADAAAHFPALVSRLLRRREFALLERSIALFDPLCPLQSFVKFIHSFLLRDYESSRPSLRQFCKSLKQGGEGSIEWCYDVANGEVAHLLSLLDYSSHDFDMFLKLLSEMDFNSVYSDLYITYSVLKSSGCDLEDDCSLFTVPPDTVLTQLLQKRLFALAREYALSGIPALKSLVHSVTLHEVRHLLEVMKSNALWQQSDYYRLQFWDKSTSLFLLHSYPKEDCMRFYVWALKGHFETLTRKELSFVIDLLTSLAGSLDRSVDDILSDHGLHSTTILHLLVTSSEQSREKIPGKLLLLTNEGEGSIQGDQCEVFLNMCIAVLINEKNDVAGTVAVCQAYMHDSYDLGLLSTAIAIAKLVDLSKQSISKCFKLIRNVISSDLIPRVNAILNADSSNDLHQCRLDVIQLLQDTAKSIPQAVEQVYIVCYIANTLKVHYDSFTVGAPYAILGRLIKELYGRSKSKGSEGEAVQGRAALFSVVKKFIKLFCKDETQTALTAGTFIKTECATIAASWGEDDVKGLAALFEDHERAIGEILMDSIESAVEGEGAGDRLALHSLTEIIIFSYHFYIESCSSNGIDQVLGAIVKATPAYCKHREYASLCKIIHFTKEYSNLKDVIALLIEEGQGGLLENGGEGDMMEAVDNYIHFKGAGDLELSTKTYLKFKMFRRIGDKLFHAASDLLLSLRKALLVGAEKRTEQEVTSNAEGEWPIDLQDDILLDMRLFTKAAEYFYQDDCILKGSLCQNWASLLAIQFENRNLVLLGIDTQQEAMDTVYQIDSYYNAQVFVNCYSHLWESQVESLWKDVVAKRLRGGDATFGIEYRSKRNTEMIKN